MRIAVTLLALVGPLPLAAQDVCPAPQPFDMPPCMVGAWVGESDMADKMNAMLARVPANMRAQMGGDMGRYLFLAVYADGFFATSPLAGDIDGQLRTEGGRTDFHIDLVATPGHGWMWAGESGAIGFCTDPHAGMAFTTFTSEGSSQVMSSPFAPPSGDMSFTALCDGDLMLMTSDLPEPIGTVTYEMHRITMPELPAEVRALYDDRMGG
jgi:hypothetical protein